MSPDWTRQKDLPYNQSSCFSSCFEDITCLDTVVFYPAASELHIVLPRPPLAGRLAICQPSLWCPEYSGNLISRENNSSILSGWISTSSYRNERVHRKSIRGWIGCHIFFYSLWLIGGGVPYLWVFGINSVQLNVTCGQPLECHILGKLKEGQKGMGNFTKIIPVLSWTCMSLMYLWRTWSSV